MRGPSSRVRRNLAKGVLPLGILASAGLVWQSSYAAFSGTTTDAGNSWTAGTVNLSNGASGATMTLNNLKPGDSGTKCVVVTYGGSLAAVTHLYVAAGDLGTSTALTGGSLAQYVTLKVDEGSGTNTGCSDFVSAANDYNPGNATTGTVADFAATYKDFASGTGGWAPGAAGDTRTYRFTWSLQDTNAAQGLNASVKFTWEAQNS
jgi:hypothetical protein